MNYRNEQKKKSLELLNGFIDDPGNGSFKGKKYPFVLKHPELNLWDKIRDEAKAYFKDNSIPWWNETDEGPTGHMQSSQVSCVNHLFFLRNNQDMATSILKNIDNRIESAIKIDYPDKTAGYVAFEIVGKENYLHEKQHSRGANATSVDALMLGKKYDGKNELFVIEWKYTENYEMNHSLYIPQRSMYLNLLERFDSPIVMPMDNEQPFEPLYYEPFYQLMRQTLLAWQMVKAGEYDCDEYVNLHVIPKANKELRLRNTSPGLRFKGKDLRSVWRSVLLKPERYVMISPDELMEPLQDTKDARSLIDYLQRRYW
ncbi:MAG: hypothetical protein LBM77_06035 [Spirochaetaceae bacterium]|jgi:hypothetical protein|nr:hypothetical protein [Spirochaetaceae bacterium]